MSSYCDLTIKTALATLDEILELDEDLREELCRHPDPEWYDPTPERHDEPGCPGGLYCPDCDQWLDLPDEATRRGI